MTQMRTIDTDYFTIIEDAHMTPVHLRDSKGWPAVSYGLGFKRLV